MVHFDRAIVQRGLLSGEARGRRFDRVSTTLWLLVFDDLRDWLLRGN
jgi:hypothetical protein